MSFQILKIVLYSTNGATRVLALRPNAVNIIAGASKTGKSALIHIVNYCLARLSRFSQAKFFIEIAFYSNIN